MIFFLVAYKEIRQKLEVEEKKYRIGVLSIWSLRAQERNVWPSMWHFSSIKIEKRGIIVIIQRFIDSTWSPKKEFWKLYWRTAPVFGESVLAFVSFQRMNHSAVVLLTAGAPFSYLNKIQTVYFRLLCLRCAWCAYALRDSIENSVVLLQRQPSWNNILSDRIFYMLGM